MLSGVVNGSLLASALESYEKGLESHEDRSFHEKEKPNERVEGDTQEDNPNGSEP